MKRAMVIVMMLAACAPTREARPGVTILGSDGRVWALQELQGERLKGKPGRVATLRLNPDRTISGTAACNSTSSAKLRWIGEPGAVQGGFDTFGRGAGISTTALCSDREAMILADRFWGLMETAAAWSIGRPDLQIQFADGSTAQLAPLQH